MIIRPENLSYIDVELSFRGSHFTTLEIDLAHVNKGGRSKFSTQEVANAAKLILHRSYLEPVAEREFVTGNCSYFVARGKFQGSYYKLVFCVCSDKPTTIGIITFHRVKR